MPEVLALACYFRLDWCCTLCDLIVLIRRVLIRMEESVNSIVESSTA